MSDIRTIAATSRISMGKGSENYVRLSQQAKIEFWSADMGVN